MLKFNFDEKKIKLLKFLHNFDNIDNLIDYFDKFNDHLSKYNLNSYLKSVSKQ